MTENTRLSINEQDHLMIGGCDSTELASTYGTPLYVMDEMVIRENMRMYRDSIEQYYDGKGLVLYASKAFCTKAMCRIADEEGIGLDVVSGGELYTAMQAGFPMNKIYFHGNNKSLDELEMALDCGIRRIVVDNVQELSLLDEMAAKKNKSIQISVRVKP